MAEPKTPGPRPAQNRGKIASAVFCGLWFFNLDPSPPETFGVARSPWPGSERGVRSRANGRHASGYLRRCALFQMAIMRLGIFGAAPYSYRALPLLYSDLSARTFELRLERRTPDLLRNVSEHYTERTSVESACVLAVCTGLDALRGVACNAVLAFFCVPHLEHTPGKSGIIAVGFDE
jgi:hypothetical protein